MIKVEAVDLSLLKKYFENRCSPDEVREVLQWVEHAEEPEELENEFKEIWQKIKVKPGDYLRWKEKLENIDESIEMETLYDSLDVGRKANHKNKAKDRFPISGQKRHHHHRSRGLKYVFSMFAIAIVMAAAASYYWATPREVVTVEPEWTPKQKSTEPGQKLSFHLEDGTRVMLNSGSVISYASHFDSLERKVVLEGEAFFEVSKEANRPFRVVTESFVTTALGTSFNVHASKNDNLIEVALVTGKVSIRELSEDIDSESLILNPGEMATVEKSTNTLKKALFDFEEKVSWKDGVISFKEASYPEITHRLENWYGVVITENKRPYKKWKFTGNFENETLEGVLIALQFGHDFNYSINGKDVKLNF